MRLSLPATLLAVASPAFSQDVAASGFELAAAPYPGGTSSSATTTLSNGDVVVFDGLEVVQYDAGGTFLVELGELSSPVFPSFLVADPDEQQVFFGDSGNGDIHRLFVGVASSPDFVVNLPFHYDAALHDAGTLHVSAATCGFGCGNEIWSVDLFTLVVTLEATVSGASGPLAFDAAGGLYYGVVTDVWPAPLGASSILHWTAAQLAGAAVLGEVDAQLIGSGFDGAARLAYDPELPALFMVENHFPSGANRIRRVGSSPAHSPVLLEGRAGLSIGSLAFVAPVGPARFGAFQPAEGGALVYSTTDFAIVNPIVERNTLLPRRPTVAVSGPGTVGAGTFDVELAHGPAHGFARLYVCPSSLYHSTESPIFLRGLPLFFGLDLPTTVALPGLLPLDADGRFLQSYSNPGNYQGQFALQFLLLDAQPRVAGTSAAGFL